MKPEPNQAMEPVNLMAHLVRYAARKFVRMQMELFVRVQVLSYSEINSLVIVP